MKSTILSIAALLTLFNTGAVHSDTQLQTPWIDRAYINDHGPVKSILVIGVPDHPDERRQLEENFAKVLSNNGVAATASLDLMPADMEVTEQNVRAALAGKEIEAVLLTRVYRTDEIEIVAGGDPGTKRTERDFALQLWENYEGARDFALNAPKNKQQRLVLENNLYDLVSAELIWTVQSYSMKPKSAKKIIESLGKLIVESLKKERLI